MKSARSLMVSRNARRYPSLGPPTHDTLTWNLSASSIPFSCLSTVGAAVADRVMKKRKKKSIQKPAAVRMRSRRQKKTTKKNVRASVLWRGKPHLTEPCCSQPPCVKLSGLSLATRVDVRREVSEPSAFRGGFSSLHPRRVRVVDCVSLRGWEEQFSTHFCHLESDGGPPLNPSVGTTLDR